MGKAARGRHRLRTMGTVAEALRDNLRALAQADARFYREMAELDRDIDAAIRGTTAPALPGSAELEIAAAIRLLEAHGYTVTPPAN